VQGTGVNILTRALALFRPALKGTGARIIGTEHDEVTLETPQAEAQEAVSRLERVMRQAGEAYLIRGLVEVEVVIAQD